MTDIQANINWCLNGYGGTLPRHKIIFGRYNPEYAAMVKKGYGECQKGKPAYQNFDFCDEASFWVAANSSLPASEKDKVNIEASTNPETGIAPAPRPKLARCSTSYTNITCILPKEEDVGSYCECSGQAGTVR